MGGWQWSREKGCGLGGSSGGVGSDGSRLCSEMELMGFAMPWVCLPCRKNPR